MTDMLSKAPRVLIIIVTYNKQRYVVELLNSLKDIAYSNYAIVVVDNASTDGTVEHLRRFFPYATLIKNEENTGGSGGFNTGLSYAFEKSEFKYYWLLDNDVVVSKDALSSLVEILEMHEDIAVAGSQMCQLDNPAVTNEVGAYVDLHWGRLVLNRHLTRKNNNSTGTFDVDYVAAASMLVRAEVAKKAGLWEDFFIHFDDVEWCLRIKEMGHKVVAVADSVIWHLSAGEKPITWAMYYDVRNMLFLLDKHASKRDVARFARRKALQAIHNELKGLTPLAEIILEAIEDFNSGIKGGKTFKLPENLRDTELERTHPGKDILAAQNEWLDLRRFPFGDGQAPFAGDVIMPEYLVDASFYWSRQGKASVKKYGKYDKFLLLSAALFGYRRYKRAYVEIRYMPYIASFLSEELAVKIGELNWLLKRDKGTVWKNFFYIIPRSLKYYIKFLF